MKIPDTIPVARGAVPVIGHGVRLLRDPLRFLRSLPAQGELVALRVGGLSMVVVCDEGLTRQVLLEDRIFDKGGLVYERIREVVGNGVASCPYADHRRFRRLIQPAFHPHRLPGYANRMTEQLVRHTAGWRDGQVIDLYRDMMVLNVRIGLETIFSGALPPRVQREAADDVAAFLAGAYRRAVTPEALNRLTTPGNRRYFQARERLRGTLADLIAQRRGSPDTGDLLSALLAPARQDGVDAPLSDEEVIDQLITFFVAGVEPAAGAVSWASLLLSRAPGSLRRFHAEVDAVLEGGPARHEHLRMLPFTRNVITETFRMYPAGWLFTRELTEDTVLGGHRLPAGVTVAYSPYLIHHRTDLHAAPEVFDPDRWPAGDRPPVNRASYIPFGGGPRRCVGEQFGFVQACLALASIGSRWILEPVDREVRPAAELALRPKNLRVTCVARGPRP
jgi:cytochrome P450